jgi:hypothetical protein
MCSWQAQKTQACFRVAVHRIAGTVSETNCHFCTLLSCLLSNRSVDTVGEDASSFCSGHAAGRILCVGH